MKKLLVKLLTLVMMISLFAGNITSVSAYEAGKVYWKIEDTTLHLGSSSYLGDESDLVPSNIYSNSTIPWYKNRMELTKVVIDDEIMPTNTAFYFNELFYVKDIQNIDKLNTSQVTNMDHMFNNCRQLTNIDLSNMNTQKVENMSYMFSSCINILKLDVSPLDTSSVKNMTHMFDNCKIVTELDLSTFDTTQVENMDNLIDNCKNIKKLNISSFDLSNLKNYDVFKYASQVMEIKTPKVTNENVNVPRADLFNEKIAIYKDTNNQMQSKLIENTTLRLVDFNGIGKTINVNNNAYDYRDMYTYTDVNGKEKVAFCLERAKSSPNTTGELYSEEIDAKKLNENDELWAKISNALVFGYAYDRGDFVNYAKTTYGLDDETAIRYVRIATQYAIWHYTDKSGNDTVGNTSAIENITQKIIEKVDAQTTLLMPSLQLNVALDSGGNRQSLLTYESKHEVKVSKQDENNRQLQDAQLKIVTSSNKEISGMINDEYKNVIQWVTTNQEDTIWLKAGTYKLQEITAPQGYEIADDIEFTVDDDGQIFINGEKVDSIIMIDQKLQDNQIKNENLDEGDDQGTEGKANQEDNKKQDNKETTKQTVKTGDTTNIISYVIMFVMSIVAVIILKKKSTFNK